MVSTNTDNIENRIAGNQRMSVSLPRQLHERLRRQADDEGESECSIIRRALRRELLGEQLIETR